MSYDVIGIGQGRHGGIMNSRSEEGAASTDHINGIIPNKILKDGYVMGSETPENILLGPHGAKVHSRTIHILEFTDLARIDEFLDLDDGRMKEQDMSYHEVDTILLSQLFQMTRFIRIEGNGFFNENMLFILQQVGSYLHMGLSRCSHAEAIKLIQGNFCNTVIERNFRE